MARKAATQVQAEADPPQGHASLTHARIAIVAASWYPEIMQGLLAGALRCLERFDLDPAQAEAYRVPGCFELIQGAARVARLHDPEASDTHRPRFSGIVTLGCLVRGETDHYDVLAHAVAAGLARLSGELLVPLSFGMLTCNTMEQALARSGEDHLNKGYEAMLALLDMLMFGKQAKTTSL
jgi:6,7-dimethyl-8-ribityllumazine synthase